MEVSRICLGCMTYGDPSRGAHPWTLPEEQARPLLRRALETDEYGKKLYVATNDGDRRVVERVGELAQKRGVSRAQIALAWLLHKPVVTAPIIGASKPQHLDDAIAALTLRLTSEEISSLEGPYVPHPVVGFA
jgi:aryl-alcohol dehydrogenase-like predicted oxidoreductase